MLAAGLLLRQLAARHRHAPTRRPADHPQNNATLKRLIISKIKAELPGATSVPLLADMALTFFSGRCIAQNVASNQAAISCKITIFTDFSPCSPLNLQNPAETTVAVGRCGF
jgi:hypothetical protein